MNAFRLPVLRWKTGVLLVLPLLLLAGGISWSAWQSLCQFQVWMGVSEPISSELLRIHLRDQLQGQWRRTRPVGNQALDLPLLELNVADNNLAVLIQAGKHPFVAVQGFFQGQPLKGELRLRGYKPWHVAEAKKSLRVKLKKGQFIWGQREFNLFNPDRPVLFENTLVLELARKYGLLALDSQFLRLHLNGMDLGVFEMGAPLDEMVLRRARLIPGDIYTLENRLRGWENALHWKYASWHNKNARQYLNLKNLLGHLHRDSPAAFADFVAQEVNLKAFVVLDLLLQIFSERNADSELNYALHYDPYLGRWQPVLLESQGFGEGPAPQRDPLMEKLSSLPAFQAEQQALLRQGLKNEIAPEHMSQRSLVYLNALRADLSADPFWRARNRLPAFDPLSENLMRPMTLTVLEQILAARLAEIQLRVQSLERSINHSKMKPQPVVVFPSVTLGPGRVVIPQTRIFEKGRRVRILAGTTLLMGPGASLIFQGPLEILGAEGAPVVIRPAQSDPWGGLVLQGPLSAGSRLLNLQVSGGSFPRWGQRIYTAMVNLHETQDLLLEDCFFSDNRGGDDLLHTVYVQNLKAHRISIRRAFSDAWDLEFTRAEIEELKIEGAGDDGLDLMGTELSLKKAAIRQCLGNGVSAGEETQVQLEQTLIAAGGVGLLAKNASVIHIDSSLLYGNRTGLKIYQASPHYGGLSRIFSRNLFLAGSLRPLQLDSTSLKAFPAPRFQSRFEQAAVLKPLKDWLGKQGNWQLWLSRTGGLP
ncbi:hypothetical protein COW36_04225 [bacterium (Candidatus Blackallbacteria) CG17_big_fil_post_rev_8_21_14_2_50_48_46]|uniref:Right handed beta helix domain-containing protein n=1 Tax=bacterium (Candidatus Blackallbacteria) CG17_big_fil_post_rev_8_21_14_2_50_48_46 TaxID=2014261 RepID=A0A2M7G8T4_9BACT|nr:MAG: hypothetical protein COW64_04720 [bacterium (Candidatus Blackallbacteria) CG18_big_fil_WC_8_21_14_2_50_49_26]PIW18505.1 MAG: hypothetical protein COW36_04225 [bacterium (Candidatus Blackallbacteria) CG17_big_fil_post_rev_8_21_14_2_50_48_46]PIW46510.1 MAG: hypothetical protein COW20_16455 [bacterium (Candidatus Blackallbacteria) CG13_big_fil_rev_8_21_14_2_50_49_14]